MSPPLLVRSLYVASLVAAPTDAVPREEQGEHERSTEGEGEESSVSALETPEPEETRTVVVDTPHPSTSVEQQHLDQRHPGFARAVALDPSSSTTAGDDVASVLSRTPGLRVRSTGGLGQFSAIQIRGSAPQQVQVFLDGVPLNDSDGGVADLSGTPLDGLAAVDVYRGYVPIAFGGATMGGAINFIGTPPVGHTTWSGWAGVGSVWTREVGGTFATPFRRGWSASVGASYAGSEGDFAYFDNGGTPQLRDDDQTTRRSNNDYNRVFAVARVDGSFRRFSLAQQLRAHWRGHGVAGTAGTQSSQSRQQLATLRSVTRLRVTELGRRHAELEWIIGVSVGYRHYRDPAGEVGIGIDDQRSQNIDVYASPRWTLPVWKGAVLRWIGVGRVEAVGIDERTVPDDANVLASGDARRSRFGFGTGVELDQHLFADVWHIVPAVRIDGTNSRFAVPEHEGEVADEGENRLDWFVSPRLGTRIRLAPGAELRGSVGRYFRAPTMYELFGDRGFVVGNEGLKPESGVNVDGGAVYQIDRPTWGVYAQVAGFWSRSSDLIQFVQSGPVIRPINLEGATTRGLEVALEAHGWGELIHVQGEYALVDSRNRTKDSALFDAPLPGRPRHEGSVQADLGYAFGQGWSRLEPRVGYAMDAVSETSLDPSDRYRLPARVLHSVTFVLHWLDGVHMGVELRNAADLRTADVLPAAGPPEPIPVPISDYIGYPLPGRSFFVRLSVDSTAFARRESSS